MATARQKYAALYDISVGLKPYCEVYLHPGIRNTATCGHNRSSSVLIKLL